MVLNTLKDTNTIRKKSPFPAASVEKHVKPQLERKSALKNCGEPPSRCVMIVQMKSMDGAFLRTFGVIVDALHIDETRIQPHYQIWNQKRNLHRVGKN